MPQEPGHIKRAGKHHFSRLQSPVNFGGNRSVRGLKLAIAHIVTVFLFTHTGDFARCNKRDVALVFTVHGCAVQHGVYLAPVRKFHGDTVHVVLATPAGLGVDNLHG